MWVVVCLNSFFYPFKVCLCICFISTAGPLRLDVITEQLSALSAEIHALKETALQHTHANAENKVVSPVSGGTSSPIMATISETGLGSVIYPHDHSGASDINGSCDHRVEQTVTHGNQMTAAVELSEIASLAMETTR